MNKGRLAWLCLGLLWSAYGWAADFHAFTAASRQAIEQANVGKPMVMAFWSVDCAYCGDDLKLLGEALQQRPDIVWVLVNTDQGNAPAASAFLDKLQLPQHQRWQFSSNDPDRLRYAVDAAWYGELPRTYFYSAQQEVQAISGKPDKSWLAQWLARQK